MYTIRIGPEGQTKLSQQWRFSQNKTYLHNYVLLRKLYFIHYTITNIFTDSLFLDLFVKMNVNIKVCLYSKYDSINQKIPDFRT